MLPQPAPGLPEVDALRSEDCLARSMLATKVKAMTYDLVCRRRKPASGTRGTRSPGGRVTQTTGALNKPASPIRKPVAPTGGPARAINRFVYIAVAIAALGGLLFGDDTGVISGAILFIKVEFSLSPTMEELVVSAVLMRRRARRRPRRRPNRTVRTSQHDYPRWHHLTALSAIGTALAPTVGWLIGARVASGIGIGIASFISPMYIAELVPAKVRGSLVAVNMLAITTRHRGGLSGGLRAVGEPGVALHVGLAVLPSIGLVLGMWWLPDSPRWLISRSKVDQGRRVLQRARTTSDVDQEIRISSRVMAQQGEGRVGGAVRSQSLRMPMIVGLGLATFQQITGINTVIYYCPDHLQARGHQRGRSSHSGGRRDWPRSCGAFTCWRFSCSTGLGRRPLLFDGRGRPDRRLGRSWARRFASCSWRASRATWPSAAW